LFRNLFESHPSALTELQSALTWYLERSETATFRFAILTLIAQLVTDPTIGSPRKKQSTSTFHQAGATL
jgi:hypothetical protein